MKKRNMLIGFLLICFMGAISLEVIQILRLYNNTYSQTDYLILLLLLIIITIALVITYLYNRNRINHHLKVENYLLESDALYGKLVDVSSDWLWQADSLGRLQFSNRKVSDILGYNPEDIVGKSIMELLSPDESSLVISTLSDKLKKGESIKDFEYKALHKNGEIVLLKKNYIPFFDSQEILLGYRGSDSDITDYTQAKNQEYAALNKDLQDALQKACESENLKTAFLSNLSHEIRTPLNAIVGFTRLLENDANLSETSKSFISIVNKSSGDLIKIIDNILKLSIIESGTLKLTETKGTVSELLNELVNFYETRNIFNEAKPISFTACNELTHEQNNIVTDFIHLKQVLNTLIENACKFTEMGEIKIGCRLFNPSKLLFFVSDTGIGIPEDMQAIIFNHFRQADDNHLIREYSGMGLGLSIVKGIVDMMEGDVWVESETNKGSTLFFTIPFKINSQ